ncbi:MAG: class II fructose-bisphosphate aldolase [Pseudomonadota bacterium]|nr:class II fructose-bisphosphate aldolase [Pseudomonadota bacterium]
MPVASLTVVLLPARAEGRAVMGAVVLGWEDAEAYVAAAEEVGCPVILQAGPKFRETLPVAISGLMFRTLGKVASVPVVAHIDHASTIDECRAGIDAGFTSVMYDGSALPVDDNIAASRAVVDLARRHGVSVEAEIGFVGYDSGAASQMTDPDEAGRLAAESGCDARAISIGNVHLQTEAMAEIDLARLAEIEAATDCPLVIHGASGVPADMRRHLALNTAICKFNVGTELRQTFGATLRRTLADDPGMFDRGQMLRATKPALTAMAAAVMRNFI